MKGSVFTVLLSLFGLCPPLSAQTITDVTASQRQDGSDIVDIQYTLSEVTEPVRVVMQVSPDEGQTWQFVESISGTLGSVASNGVYSVSWDAKKDRPEVLWPNTQVRIIALTPELTIFLPGDVSLVMVPIPSGTFMMGSPLTERSRGPDEGPQTTVTLSYDFYMSKHEVTQAQWMALMGSWPGSAPSYYNGSGDNFPAYNLSWNDTQDFVTALNSHLAATGQGPATMRLPSEAEWEYACRAGTTTRFFFGDSLIGSSGGDSCEDDGLRRRHMWYCAQTGGAFGGHTTTEGISMLPNTFGIKNMHGNALEWCQDWYFESLPGGKVSDPIGPSQGSHKVLRGGYGRSHASFCRSASRAKDVPSSRQSYYGFRLVSVR